MARGEVTPMVADATPSGITSPSLPRTHRWVHLAALPLALAGLYHLALLYRIFFARLAYPLDLEWMEGGMLCHALRLVEGKPLYAPPSADFISYLYTPLYPVVLAGLGEVFGLSYMLGRLVSIIAFTGTLTLIARVVQRESGAGAVGWLWGVGAAGLAASSFQYTGTWYDLVRNDSLYMLLTTSGLYLLLYHRRTRGLVAASLLLGLAFLTKQTASLFILYSGAALLLLRWRRLPLHVAVVGLVAGGTVLLWNHLSHGWFWKYTYEMHQGHDFYWDRIWPVTEQKLLHFFPAVAAVLGLWALLGPGLMVARVKGGASRRGALFWFFVALMGVLWATPPSGPGSTRLSRGWSSPLCSWGWPVPTSPARWQGRGGGVSVPPSVCCSGWASPVS